MKIELSRLIIKWMVDINILVHFYVYLKLFYVNLVEIWTE